MRQISHLLWLLVLERMEGAIVRLLLWLYRGHVVIPFSLEVGFDRVADFYVGETLVPLAYRYFGNLKRLQVQADDTC